MVRDLVEAISITTFRVWKNNIGKGGIKDFFKGGGIKERGLFEKGEGINTLCELSDYINCSVFNDIKQNLHYNKSKYNIHCYLMFVFHFLAG